MDNIYDLADVEEKIRSDIEALSSVQAAYIYGAEFEENDFDYFKGSVEFGTTCLLVGSTGKPQLSRNKRTIETEVNYSVFIVGLNDFDDENKIAASRACLNTISELTVLIINNNFGFSVTESDIGDWQYVDNTLEKNKRVSVYLLTFSLTFKTNNAINNQLNI